MARCDQEMCPNWSGDGEVCPCAVFDLNGQDDVPDPLRCELDFNPDGGNDGVCLARLDRRGNCTRKGGSHDIVTGSWAPLPAGYRPSPEVSS